MLGLSRKRTANVQEAAIARQAKARAPMPEDGPESLLQSFQVLEQATLSLDGIAHALSEARMLARIACRPEGAAQRALIAGRYAAIRSEIEGRSKEAALENSDRLMVLLGGTEDGRQGSLVTRSLPASRFESPEEAKAIVRAMDFALKAIDEEATHLREAAGHLADQLARGVRPARPAPRETAAPPKVEARPARSRHAA